MKTIVIIERGFLLLATDKHKCQKLRNFNDHISESWLKLWQKRYFCKIFFSFSKNHDFDFTKSLIMQLQPVKPITSYKDNYVIASKKHFHG